MRSNTRHKSLKLLGKIQASPAITSLLYHLEVDPLHPDSPQHVNEEYSRELAST
jgi:hypothetical protein